jgi:hypothetical protein
MQKPQKMDYSLQSAPPGPYAGSERMAAMTAGIPARPTFVLRRMGMRPAQRNYLIMLGIYLLTRNVLMAVMLQPSDTGRDRLIRLPVYSQAPAPAMPLREDRVITYRNETGVRDAAQR